MHATCHTHFTIHDIIALLIYPTYKELLKIAFDTVSHISELNEKQSAKQNK